jgi:hypothetical protein
MPAWPSTLPAPNKNGYALNPAPAFSRTNMEGGKARQRRRFTTVPVTVPLNWLFTQTQLGIFEAWFKHEINDGASYFDMTLWNGKGFNTYSVRFKKEPSIVLNGAKYFMVSGEIEVFNLQTMTKTELQAYL